MSTNAVSAIEQTPDELAAPAAAPPRWPRLRLALGAITLAIFCFWLGARLGPSSVFGSGSGLTTGTWLPTPSPAEAYIGGAVAHPGLYALAPNARLADVLRRAGGPRRDADLSYVNMAMHVSDGATITIPRRRVRGRATG